ncbi:MAG: ISAzo13-like element transposase-related protein [Planctomycetia bacterium]
MDERRRSGRRKLHAATQPALVEALDRLVEPGACGSPTNPLRWTIQSTHRLTDELRPQGFTVGASSAPRTLAGMGCSVQANQNAKRGLR